MFKSCCRFCWWTSRQLVQFSPSSLQIRLILVSRPSLHLHLCNLGLQVNVSVGVAFLLSHLLLQSELLFLRSQKNRLTATRAHTLSLQYLGHEVVALHSDLYIFVILMWKWDFWVFCHLWFPAQSESSCCCCRSQLWQQVRPNRSHVQCRGCKRY